MFALVVACSGGKSRQPLPVPTTTSTAPVTYPDHSSDSLGTVAGITTLTVRLTPGTATINGAVVDDTGAPVPGAIVHLERVVGSQLAAADIAAAADGTYAAQGIIGGLYRVRAWRIPDLALINPQIFFLGSSQTFTTNLQLQRFTGQQISNSMAPNPPIIDQPATLVVEVATDAVGTDGVVRGKGRAGASVQLVGQGQWTIDGSLTQTSDSGGLVTWQVTCTALGSQPLGVVVDGTDSYPLNLSACSPVPPTTTTTTTTTTTSGTPTTVSGRTTTTRRTLVGQ